MTPLWQLIDAWHLWPPEQHLHSEEMCKIEEELVGKKKRSTEGTVEYVRVMGVNTITAKYVQVCQYKMF